MGPISLNRLPPHQGLFGHFIECLGRGWELVTDIFGSLIPGRKSTS